jgi:8-hydroxy-5-deazaflavin:NADPH oxidoreductase
MQATGHLLNDASADLGVLGTGRMGVRLAAMFAKAGRTVVLGSRSRARAEEIVQTLGIAGLIAGTYDEAAGAKCVLPAIFIRDGLFDILDEYETAISGKLLIDISNPFNEDYSDFITPWDSSGAEELQQHVPHARVVGAFKNVFWEVFDAPLFEGVASDVLVAGDDDGAKREFMELSAGTPFRYLDAGPLINARTIERLTLITGRLGRQLDAYPRMNWRLLGSAWRGGQNQQGIDRIIARAGA